MKIQIDELLEESKRINNPVCIIHPDSNFDFKNSCVQLRRTKKCPIDRIYLVSEANLYQFNLDDIEAI